VSRVARMMVSQMGFSKKLGQVAWSSQGGNSFLGAQMAQPSDCSGDTQDAIDAEVKDIVDRAYRRAKDLVQSNIAVLHKTADLLMEREQIDGEDLQALLVEAQAEQYLKSDEPSVSIPYRAA
jgi:cell division protease FtsH